MAIYYGVLSSVENGVGDAGLWETIETEAVPQNMHTKNNGKDIYLNWFTSEEKAKEFIGSVKNGK